ncbi:MAG: hypothetical protein GY755_11650 [Chloroflexi bacterium]|nr:hypothetical protein [Chloroflexota bacterium]
MSDINKFISLVITFILWVALSIVANVEMWSVIELAYRRNWSFPLIYSAGYFVAGLINGIGQWVILKKYFSRENIFLWMPLTAIGLPVGYAFGFLFPAIVGSLPHHIPTDWIWIIDGSIAGAFVGVLQWLVIRNKVNISFLWIPISAIVWGVSASNTITGYVYRMLVLPLSSTIPNDRVWLVILGVAGVILGVGQWLINRKKVNISFLWIPISVLALITRYVYKILDVDRNTAIGIIVGVISGIAIVLMLANTKEIWNKKTEDKISQKFEN